MRASKSSIQCRIFLFHCGGTIWRTSARFSEVRSTFQHPLYELRKTKGTGKSQILVPLFDLRFLVGLAGCAAGTSNRRHQDPLVARSAQASGWAPLRRLARMLRQTQGDFAPLGP